MVNARAALKERLARWLLMLHDRAKSDELSITHDALSFALGVRRAGITEALQQLSRSGAIRSERGHIYIADRLQLEAATAGFYSRV